MRAGWKTAPLGEVCTLIARGIAPKYVENGGALVINQKCIRDHAITYALSRKHDAAAKRIAPDRFIQLGDVLVNSTGTGTLGRVAQVRKDPPEPSTVDTHVTIVRPIPGEFYQDFFGYALITLEDKLEASGEGASGQTELARSTIAKFEITYPTDLEEQRRIVEVLDGALAAIAIATANAKKNLANADSLFSSCLEAVFETGGANWEARTLGDVCRFVGGSQPPKAVFSTTKSEGMVRLIQIRDYKSDRYQVFIPKNLSKRFCVADDVMIGRYGPPLFQILRGLEGAYNVALMKAAADTRIVTKEFLYFFMRNARLLRHVIAASDRAAGQIGLTKETLETYPISFPELAEQATVVDRLTSIEAETVALKAAAAAKMRAFIELEQCVLSKAFSGDLDTVRLETLNA